MLAGPIGKYFTHHGGMPTPRDRRRERAVRRFGRRKGSSGR
jgi:hypothetical protein